MPADTLLLHCSMHPLSIAAPQIQCASLPNPERISVSKLPPQYCTVSFACSTESAEGMASIIKLVEKLRDLQRIVLPTQVVEAPDG